MRSKIIISSNFIVQIGIILHFRVIGILLCILASVWNFQDVNLLLEENVPQMRNFGNILNSFICKKLWSAPTSMYQTTNNLLSISLMICGWDFMRRDQFFYKPISKRTLLNFMMTSSVYLILKKTITFTTDPRQNIWM